jgi:hypothetical protein
MAALLLIVQSGQEAMAADQDNGKSCGEKLVAVGRPNKIQSLSGMSAVVQWKRRAGELGEKFVHWQYAMDAELNCKFMRRSGYYICYASGKPCEHPSPIRAGIEDRGGGKR